MIFLYIFIALLLIMLVAAFYVGAFNKATLRVGSHGGYTVAGKKHKGPYSKVGKVFREVDQRLRSINIESHKGFGMYFDNPRTTNKEDLRSFVGNVIEGKGLDRLEAIEQAGLIVDEIPEDNAVIIELPTPNNLSFIVNPLKAYPKLEKYLKKTGKRMIRSYEIYDIPAKKGFYVMHFTE